VARTEASTFPWQPQVKFRRIIVLAAPPDPTSRTAPRRLSRAAIMDMTKLLP
jgi:hypothetical protein